jgi:acyl carrier protein
MESDARTPPTPPSKEAIQSWLQLRIAEGTQATAEEIDATLPFSSYGLDSVASLGISGELEIWLGRKLPQTLTWDYPNIERLSAFLAQAE